MRTFHELLEAVEENNRINNAKWTDWEDASHIQDVYGELDKHNKILAEIFLNSLIHDNGDHLQLLQDAFDAVNCGIVFSR